MKWICSAVLILSVIGLSSADWYTPYPPVLNLEGAWKSEQGVIICTPNYLAVTDFSVPNKTFKGTWGGPYTQIKDTLKIKLEFSTYDKNAVGTTQVFVAKSKKGLMLIDPKTKTKQVWTRISEEGPVALAGLWQISGRMVEGQLRPMPKSARKTIKIFSKTRFQWAAINTQTGEFFGTGGGQYTLKNNQYTEQLEFFSRDSSRVGMSLSFEARVEGNQWTHLGKSSTGSPVHEVWERQ